MIAMIARATRWEWFKLRRRWMPWILLVILLLFSQLGVWSSFVGYRQLESGGEIISSATGQAGRPTTVRCADVLAEPPNMPGAEPAVGAGLRAQCSQLAVQRAQQLPMIYGRFTLPGSITQALGTASAIGGILIAVLAASTVGVEYSWGTMRTALVRGTGRWQYLAGKLAVLLLAALGALVVIAVVTAVSSTIASALTPAPAGFVVPAWSAAFEAVGRAWFGFVPMIALVVM
ncbi:MAG: ABC transporter permease subunit, partial [Chloroflexota bacterium]